MNVLRAPYCEVWAIWLQKEKNVFLVEVSLIVMYYFKCARNYALNLQLTGTSRTGYSANDTILYLNQYQFMFYKPIPQMDNTFIVSIFDYLRFIQNGSFFFGFFSGMKMLSSYQPYQPFQCFLFLTVHQADWQGQDGSLVNWDERNAIVFNWFTKLCRHFSNAWYKYQGVSWG